MMCVDLAPGLMTRRPLALLAAAILLAACSRGARDDAPRSESTPSVPAAGDLRIQNTTGQLDLALTGDTISAGLAGDVLDKARHATDSASVSGTGMGSAFERMVKSSVQNLVTSRVRFPVSAVKDVRYRDGAIEFDWYDRPPRLLEQTKVNKKPFLESFSPEDAQRFVQAVKARIAMTR